MRWSSACRWPRWAVLLSARLFDAFIDPLIGRATDQLLCRAARCAGLLVLRISPWWALAAGFARSLFFFPPASRPGAGLWATLALVLMYAGVQPADHRAPGLGRYAGGDEAQPQPHRRGARAGTGRRAAGVRCCRHRSVLTVDRVLAVTLALARVGPARTPARAAPGCDRTARPPAWRLFRARRSGPAGGVCGHRHRQRGAGHAGVVLCPGPPAGAAPLEPAFLGSYFPCAAAVHPAVAARLRWAGGWSAAIGRWHGSPLPPRRRRGLLVGRGGAFLVCALSGGARHRPRPCLAPCWSAVIADARATVVRRRVRTWLVELRHQAHLALAAGCCRCWACLATRPARDPAKRP